MRDSGPELISNDLNILMNFVENKVLNNIGLWHKQRNKMAQIKT